MKTLPKKSIDLIDKIAKNPAHGYLVVGGKSTSVDSFVKLLAKSITGSHSNADETKNILRLLPDKNGKIGKEQVNQLLTKVNVKQRINQRVVLIENSQMLSLEAHNSLLKVIEEPGTNTTLIVSTESLDSLPKTVISRLQVLRLSKVPLNQLASSYGADSFSTDELRLLSLASGNDTSLLEMLARDSKSKRDFLETVEMSKKILTSDVYKRMIITKSIWKDRKQLERLLLILLQLCHGAMYNSKANLAKTKQWAQRIDTLLKAESSVKSNVSPRLIISELMVQL